MYGRAQIEKELTAGHGPDMTAYLGRIKAQ